MFVQVGDGGLLNQGLGDRDGRVGTELTVAKAVDSVGPATPGVFLEAGLMA